MSGQVPVRSEISDAFKWSIGMMYSDQKAWEEDLNRIDALVEPIEALKGQLNSAALVARSMALEVELDRLIEKVYVFAHLQEDQNTDDADSQSSMARIRAKYTDVQSRLAWITPEILTQDLETLQQWADAEEMAEFRYSMVRLTRQKAHTLSEKEETLLSKASEIFSASSQTYNLLTNADIRFEKIRDEQDELVEMSDGRYVQFLMSRDRRVRQDAFGAMYATYGGIKNTVASTLSSHVKMHNYFASVRGHGSAVQAALFGDQIPVELYDTLIQTTRDGLPHYFKYLKLRKDLLKLDQLDMYDMYVPLVPEFDMKVPFEQAKEWVIEACKPLGEEYGAVLESAFDDKWMDIYENRGKRSGAYSSGCYDSLPYILLNYQDTLNDVFTLAHELGHSMHTWLANHSQPPQTAHYPIFIAEIASTLNEELLLRFLLKRADDPAMKAYLLNHYCDSFKGTVYRQTMFAEFEKRIHEMDADGQPLTRESLSELYASINREYYGPDVTQDERIAMEWMRIPHFYYNFYVYKYSTSFCASQIFANRVLESEAYRDDYLNLLRSGGSADPLDLIKKAGVDLTDPTTLSQTFGTFSDVLAELSGLLMSS